MKRPRRIVLIGATGSIGASTLQVLRAHPSELALLAVANGSRAAELMQLARQWDIPPERAVCAQRDGEEAVCQLAALPDADIVLLASSGTQGLRTALAAIEAGKILALASKEILLLAGSLVMEAARRKGTQILPVDSEHNGLFQCLQAAPRHAEIKRILLTASGGPFRDWSQERIASATPSDALQHPNWSMGRKITIDSATLANKGLEMIEARWLFDLPPEKVEAVIHRQSIVHALLQFCDGSTLAQLSPPSMTFAIQHCLFYPERRPATLPGIDFTQPLCLGFEPPDEGRFPCLRLAREAMQIGASAPLIYNCANTVAVKAFLDGRIPFPEIPSLIEKTLELMPAQNLHSIDEILLKESQTQDLAEGLLSAKN